MIPTNAAADLVPLTALPFLVLAAVARGRPGQAAVLSALVAGIAAAVLAFGAMSLPNYPLAAAMLVTAAVIGSLIPRETRVWLAEVMPIDPDNATHAVAVAMAVGLFGTQVAIELFTNVLAGFSSQPPDQPADFALGGAAYFLLTVFGLGWLWFRTTTQTADRLGYRPPSLPGVGLAFAVAGLITLLAVLLPAIGDVLTPDLSRQVNAADAHLFTTLSTPAGLIVISVFPAIGEEALFRGALQPRLGLVATAILFAAVHTEYGLSMQTLWVLCAAILLGLLRKVANTTSTTICHALFNFLQAVAMAANLSLEVTLGITAVLLMAGAVMAGAGGFRLDSIFTKSVARPERR